jgi:hypothetical protein
MFDQPPKQKPRQYQMAGSSRSVRPQQARNNATYLSDANSISSPLFAWQLSNSLTTMPNCCRFLTWRVCLVVDERSDAQALIGDRNIFSNHLLDGGGATTRQVVHQRGRWLLLTEARRHRFARDRVRPSRSMNARRCASSRRSADATSKAADTAAGRLGCCNLSMRGSQLPALLRAHYFCRNSVAKKPHPNLRING